MSLLQKLAATLYGKTDQGQQLKTERDAWKREFLILLGLVRRYLVATRVIQPKDCLERNALYQAELTEAQIKSYLKGTEYLTRNDNDIFGFQAFRDSELARLVNEYLSMWDYARSRNLTPDEVYSARGLTKIRGRMAEASGYACPFTADELNPQPPKKTEAEKERDALKEAVTRYLTIIYSTDDWPMAKLDAAEARLVSLTGFQVNSVNAADLC